MCTFLSLSFLILLGKYWSTRTEGYTGDARTACKFHVLAIIFLFHCIYNWCLVFQFGFYVGFLIWKDGV